MSAVGSSAVQRVMWPYGVLLIFVLVIRLLPAATRSAGVEDDCERVSRTDHAAMERCSAIHPDDVELLIDLGDWYRTAGDRSRAQSLYAAASKIDPEDAEVRRRLDAGR